MYFLVLTYDFGGEREREVEEEGVVVARFGGIVRGPRQQSGKVSDVAGNYWLLIWLLSEAGK